MLIYKYDLNSKPGYVRTGGFYARDNWALGFGTVTGSHLEVSVVDALAWGASFSFQNVETEAYLTIPEKVTQMKALLEDHGCTVTAQDEADAVAPARELIMDRARNTRNELLTESDWTQLDDSPLGGTPKTEWATYRQALRDIPENNPNINYYEEITWPDAPSS